MTAENEVPAAAFLLPATSAVGYVLAVLLLKRAATLGAGLWRTTFVANNVMAVAFAPFWLLGGRDMTWTTVWQAGAAAALFFAGQIFTFLALAGHVSLATPVLGLKILFVAAASALLVAEPVRAAWWWAAALGTAGVALLQWTPGGGAGARDRAKTGATVAFAALAAACFAVADVLVQRFAPIWGVGRFLPAMFAWVAIFSLGLPPFFDAPLSRLPRETWRWLAPGALLLAAQAAGMAYTLGTHGRATAANVLYGTRGLWSVLAVGLLGAWLGSAEERALPASLLRRRLLGAGLMLAAVALVLE
jgi:drug/metabolite transporter (DMT)-like permease